MTSLDYATLLECTEEKFAQILSVYFQFPTKDIKRLLSLTGSYDKTLETCLRLMKSGKTIEEYINEYS